MNNHNHYNHYANGHVKTKSEVGSNQLLSSQNPARYSRLFFSIFSCQNVIKFLQLTVTVSDVRITVLCTRNFNACFNLNCILSLIF